MRSHSYSRSNLGLVPLLYFSTASRRVRHSLHDLCGGTGIFATRVMEIQYVPELENDNLQALKMAVSQAYHVNRDFQRGVVETYGSLARLSNEYLYRIHLRTTSLVTETAACTRCGHHSGQNLPQIANDMGGTGPTDISAGKGMMTHKTR